MPEFLVHKVLVLHSPPVLLPRTARLYAKLTSGYCKPAPLGALGIGRMLESLVCGVLILHSPPVLYAPLPKLASGLWQSPATGCRGIKTGKNNVPSACVMPDLRKVQALCRKRPYSELFCLLGLFGVFAIAERAVFIVCV